MNHMMRPKCAVLNFMISYGGYEHYYYVNEERGNIGPRHGISVGAGAVDVHLGKQVHVFEWSMLSISVMPLCQGLQERNHGWGG